MHGADAEGGRAQVERVDAPATGLDEFALQKDSGGDVLVLVSGTNGDYRAESYQADGTPIQLCGHGALAAAFAVLTELEPTAGELAFHSRRYAWRARKADTAAADITLSFPTPAVTTCAVPDFAAAVFRSVPVAAAEVGEDDDYLVLEFASADDVRRLTPDFAALTSATRRAVIATAADNDAVVFRYFAPQYGQPEDAATGSAALQLAAYWAPKLKKACFGARQLSAAGAVMQLARHKGVVELSARVAYGD